MNTFGTFRAAFFVASFLSCLLQDVHLGKQAEPKRYAAVLVKVHDGDTVVCHVDLGFRFIRLNEHVRLLGINAPELNTTGGVASKNHLAELLTKYDADPDEDGVQLTLVTEGDDTDNFGRTLARIEGKNGVDLCKKMLADGYAEEYKKR